MDVTSLLNAASTRREGIAANHLGFSTHTPSRNRTPWDAGGYSLPINPASQNETFITSASESVTPLDDKRESTLASSNSLTSNHKLSDSRSSISSFASTTSTSQHSRLSSISTVSSFYPLSVITDIEKYSSPTSATPTPDQGHEIQSSTFRSIAPPYPNHMI